MPIKGNIAQQPEPEITPAPKQTLWRRFLRFNRRLVVGVFLIGLAIIILIQFAFVQTFLAGFGLQYLSDKTGFRIEAKGFYFNPWTSRITLNQVQIRDKQNKPMVAAEQLRLKFDYETALKNGNIQIEEVLLKRAAINLIVDERAKTLNITEFIDNIEKVFGSDKPKQKSATPSLFHILKADISDTYFSYYDNTKPYSAAEGMDYAHFGIDDMNAELKNLRIIGDTIESVILGMKGTESKTQLKIKNLTTHYRFTDKTMEFRNLLCEFGNSTLRDELFLHFRTKKDLSDFVKKVTLIAYLDSTVIDTRDLVTFAPALKIYQDIWRLNGIFRGRINDFKVTGMDLQLGKQTQVTGQIAIKGIPDTQKMQMQFNLAQAHVAPTEIAQYINQPLATEFLQKFGTIQFQGSYQGTIRDFQTKGRFQTALGNFDANLHLILRDNQWQSYYKGDLTTEDLHIGQIFGLKDLQTIALTGKVEGTGFTPATAKLRLDAVFKSLIYKGYNYKDIEIDGDLSRQRFKGELIAQDPNFDFTVNGEIDFAPKSSTPGLPPGRFDLQADIRQISLKPLGFSPVEAVIKGKLFMDTYGLSLDSLSGEATLSEAFVLYDGKGIDVKSLELLSFKEPEGNRLFDIRSELFDFHAYGKFLFSKVLTDLPELAQEYVLSFQNEPAKIETYYRKKKKRNTEKYNINYEVSLKNINPVLSLFKSDMFVSKNIRFTGEFAQGQSSKFSLLTERNIDSLFYGANRFYNTHLDLNTSKIANSPEILAESVLTSARQRIGGLDLEQTTIDAFWGDNQIDFDLRSQQLASDNHAKLQGTVRFVNDSTLIRFRKSELHILEDKWLITKNNEININPEGISFRDFTLYNEQNTASRISLDGVVSDTLLIPLKLDVAQFDLTAFAAVLGLDISGTVNGEASMENLLKQPRINGNWNFENVVYSKVLIGDAEGKAYWDEQKQDLKFETMFYRRGRYILDITGSYKPTDRLNALDITVKFNRTDLEILEPFAKDFISNVRGTGEGKLYIRGSATHPNLTGKVTIRNSRFRFNLLNTFYEAEGDIVFKPNEIGTTNTVLFDDYSNPATVKATLFHDNFKDLYLTAKSNFYNFQVLNTEASPKAMYYGTAYASGDMSINGYLNNLTMDIRARSRKGTKIFLPLDGYQETSEKEYIQFVQLNKTDTLNFKKVNLGGLKLNFNLTVTPEAEMEIILDSRSGDKISASGRGDIDMRVDTEGDFSMLGYYVIQQGKYNFTFANFVNKGFNIAPGSRINFNGDVYSSVLDVRALYEKNVVLKPLLESDKITNPDSPELRQAYPIRATLDMKGNFLEPEVRLGLDLSEAKKVRDPNLQSAVMQLDNAIRNDEQERNRQVFSLLILNQLSSPNSFSGVGQAFGNSVSELISNQFSNWISQVDENLEFSFNIDNNFNTFSLRFSYNFLDGRLRITRDGAFTTQQRQADIGSIIGDWTIEYLLTPSGKYRLKTYYKNNQNILNNVNLNAGSSSTGFSFLHTANFNSFGELFTPLRKRQSNLLAQQSEENRGESDTDFLIIDDKIKAEEALELIQENARNPLNQSEEAYPLPHRYDTPTLRHLIVQTIDKDTTGKQSNTSQEKPNYKEDIDNEEMPERYKEDSLKKEQEDKNPTKEKQPKKTKDKDKNKQIPTEKTPVTQAHVVRIAGDCPLPHRFDGRLR